MSYTENDFMNENFLYSYNEKQIEMPKMWT